MTQFLRDEGSDSEEVLTPLMLDRTYLSRNFATLGPFLTLQPPCLAPSIGSRVSRFGVSPVPPLHASPSPFLTQPIRPEGSPARPVGGRGTRERSERGSAVGPCLTSSRRLFASPILCSSRSSRPPSSLRSVKG